MASWVIVRSNARSIVFSSGGGSGQHTSEIARNGPEVDQQKWNEGLEVVFFVSLKNGWIIQLFSSTTSMNLRYTMRKNTVDSLNWSFMVSACFNHALCAPLQHYHIYQGYKLRYIFLKLQDMNRQLRCKWPKCCDRNGPSHRNGDSPTIIPDLYVDPVVFPWKNDLTLRVLVLGHPETIRHSTLRWLWQTSK